MQYARSLLFAVLFYPATFVLSVSGLIASLFGHGPTLVVVRGWAKLHRWLTWNLLGIGIRIEGEVPQGCVLIAAKHQAMFETIDMVLVAHAPVIVLKRELANIPLFGWITRRYGVIPVDREAGAKALRQMLTLARSAKAAGRAIIIYPEGTRVRPGEKPPLRPGFAGMYRALGLPVVPIALDSGRVWGRGVLKNPGIVTFKVGEVIPAGLPRDEIEARVHTAINALES